MSRKEFMDQLEQLLSDIPKEERTEALTYYNGYFEDAGEENEESIIQELESPQKVARIIKADMGLSEEHQYTESGYEDTRFRQRQEVDSYTGAGDSHRSREGGYGSGQDEGGYDSSRGQSSGYGSDQDQSGGYGSGQDQSSGYASGQGGGYEFQTKKASDSAPKRKDPTRTLLLVLLAVFTCPIWLGLLGGFFGLLIGGVATIFALLLAVVLIVFVFFVVGFVLAGVGISLFTIGNIGAGLGVSGAGLIMLALAVLGLLACVVLFGRFLPWIVKGCVNLCSRLFHRKGSVA